MSPNKSIVRFVIILCFSSALILSVLASVLYEPQEKAKKLYLYKQLLMASALIKPDHTLSNEEILNIVKERVTPMLTNRQGELFTFDEANLNLETYLQENQKTGYANLSFKLVYFISNEPKTNTPYAYVIPVNGYGLWDAIYGFIALKPDADTVIGIAWYEQKETPGLGAEISDPKWQAQFKGKKIFQENPDGTTSFNTAPIGIFVSKTPLKDSPKANSAVDGISGATETGRGVTESYKNSLTPYREFLIRARKEGV